MIIGDFNAKLGRKQDESEFSIGKYGIGERNDRRSFTIFLSIICYTQYINVNFFAVFSCYLLILFFF